MTDTQLWRKFPLNYSTAYPRIWMWWKVRKLFLNFYWIVCLWCVCASCLAGSGDYRYRAQCPHHLKSLHFRHMNLNWYIYCYHFDAKRTSIAWIHWLPPSPSTSGTLHRNESQSFEQCAGTGNAAQNQDVRESRAGEPLSKNRNFNPRSDPATSLW